MAQIHKHFTTEPYRYWYIANLWNDNLDLSQEESHI
jgi:hypothetical protein